MNFIFYSLLISIIILWFFSLFKPLNQDEGVFLFLGKAINVGQLPYKDYFDHKTPGIYLLAYLINLFTLKSIIFIRIIVIILNLLIAYQVFLLSQKLNPQAGPLAAIIYLYASYFYQGNYFLTEIPMLSMILAAYILIIKKNNYFFAGVFLALAFLFKQTAVLNFLITIIFIICFEKNRFNKFYQLFLGYFLIFIFFLIALFVLKIESYAFNQIFLDNLARYPADKIIFVINRFFDGFKRTFWIWLIPIFALFLNKKRTSEPWIYFMWMNIFLALPFLLNRGYFHYWLQVLPFMAILCSLALINMSRTKITKIIIPIILLSFIINLRWSYLVFKYTDLSKYKETLQITELLKKNDHGYLLAENEYTGFYYLTKKLPVSKYLYITEISNNSEESEQKTIQQLYMHNNLDILWPIKKDQAYAQSLQKTILESSTKIQSFDNIGVNYLIK